MADLDAGVHYYRHSASSAFQVWTSDVTLARWEGVARPLAQGGSARPTWHALRAALVRGDVEVLEAPVGAGTELASFARHRDAVFLGSPFNLSTAGVQLSPCDESCDAGEVAIHRDPSLAVVVTSGELFTLRPAERPVRE